MRSTLCRKFPYSLPLLCLLAFGGTRARADGNDCGNPPKVSHYVPQPGDVEGATHLSLARAFSGSGHLELNVCAGEVRIRPSKDGQLHLEVETQETPELKLRAYLKTVDVTADSATISIQLPKKDDPAVYLDVPATPSLHSEINVGAGELRFHADGYGGDRELNLGAGHATIYLDGDRDYARLEANVGMGSFHDRRPGGQSGHFTISKDLEGKGSAPLQVNVGAGSLDLKQAE